MPEFGEEAGRFVGDLFHSLQEEIQRLPSVPEMMEAIKGFNPTPEQVGDWAAKSAEALTKVANDIVRGVREAGRPSDDPMPDHIDIPDDLSDL
jgi:hypothetical protein